MKRASYLKEKSLPNYVLLGKLKSSVNEITNWLTNVAATRFAEGYDEGYKHAEGNLKIAKSVLDKLIENYIKQKKDTTQLKKINKQIDTFYEVGKEMAFAYRDGGTDAGNEMMSVFFGVSKEFRLSIQNLEKEIESSHEETVDSMENDLTTTRIITIVFSTIFAILGIVLSIIISNYLVGPIRKLIHVIRVIQEKKDLSQKVEVKGKDEMAALSEEFNYMMDKLFENDKELRATRDALWGEMELAKKIQTCLVPENPKIEGCEVLGFMQTADEVGGDYYDVINPFKAGQKNWFVIGDVSGHGVPAGLVMMMVQSLVNSIIHTGYFNSPAEVLIEVNKTLTENIRKLSENKYMTITLFAMDEKGNIEFAGAHQDIVTYRKKTKSIEFIETTGFWIGIEDDIEPFINNEKTKINKGDVMVLYTDGVTESVNREQQMFEKRGIKAVLEKYHDESLEVIRDNLLSSLKEYKNNDDITFMLLRKS